MITVPASGTGRHFYFGRVLLEFAFCMCPSNSATITVAWMHVAPVIDDQFAQDVSLALWGRTGIVLKLVVLV